MATSGFGAKVKLSVDKSGKTEFNKQITEQVKPIKISEQFTVLQKDMDRVRSDAQAKLNKKPITLKVGRIDCSSAIADVQQQLSAMLSSLSVSNGVNISGLKDFAGGAKTGGSGSSGSSSGGGAGGGAIGQGSASDNSKNERARLATLEQLYSLLTKLEEAEKKWTAAQNSTSSSYYRQLAADVTTLQEALEELSGESGEALEASTAMANAQRNITTIGNDEYTEILNTLAEVKTRYAAVTEQIKYNDEATRSESQAAIESLQKRRDALQSYITVLQNVRAATPEQADKNAGVVTDYQKLSDDIDAVARSGEVAQEAIQGLVSRMDALEPAAKSTANVRVQLQALSTQVSATDQALRNLGIGASKEESESIAALADRVANLKVRLTELQATMNNPKAQNTLTGDVWESMSEEIQSVSAEIQKIGGMKALWGDTGQNAALTRINNLMSELTRKQNAWTAAATGGTKEYYDGITQCISNLKGLKDQVADNAISPTSYAKTFADINAKAKEATTAIVAAHKNTLALSDRLGGLAKKFTSWLSVSQIIMFAVRSLRQMITNVKEIDSAMTQLQIVTGATDTQMEKFLTNSIKLAKELGQSVTDVLGSIETFSRLGYNLTEASELAKYAGILANVANVDTSEATTGITSIIKGYNMDVQNAEHVADVLVEVGQKYAVSASEMMEAYEKSGAALNATNTSFEKSAGLIAAANAAVELCRAA